MQQMKVNKRRGLRSVCSSSCMSWMYYKFHEALDPDLYTGISRNFFNFGVFGPQAPELIRENQVHVECNSMQQMQLLTPGNLFEIQSKIIAKFRRRNSRAMRTASDSSRDRHAWIVHLAAHQYQPEPRAVKPLERAHHNLVVGGGLIKSVTCTILRHCECHKTGRSVIS